MRLAITTALLLAGSLALISPAHAAAQDQGDFTVCAAIFPCDQNGDILPHFNDRSGPCYKTYAAQCYEIKSDLLKECQIDKQKMRKAKRRAKKR